MDFRKIAGLTLVELLTVISIIGIISLVAFPSYKQYLIEARRFDAIVALRDYQIVVENYIADNSQTPNSITISNPTTNGFYNISYTRVDSTRYRLTATAVSTKSQNLDTNCNPLIVTGEVDEIMPFDCR